jgi:hypothetical protein
VRFCFPRREAASRAARDDSGSRVRYSRARISRPPGLHLQILRISFFVPRAGIAVITNRKRQACRTRSRSSVPRTKVNQELVRIEKAGRPVAPHFKYQEEKVGCSGSVSSALSRIASRREASPLRDPRALRENFRAKRAAILSKVHSFLCQAKLVYAIRDHGRRAR